VAYLRPLAVGVVLVWNGGMVGELWLTQDVEGSCRGVIWGYVMWFSWRSCGNPTKFSKCPIFEPRVEPGRAAFLLNRTTEAPEHKYPQLARFESSAVVWLKSSLFSVVSQRILVTGYRCFGTTSSFNPLKRDGHYTETSVTTCQPTQRNVAQRRRPLPLIFCV